MIVMFAFIGLGAKAEGSQWLTNLIAEQEGLVSANEKSHKIQKERDFLAPMD
ncbi:hypothetical protein PGH45_20130 [Legionella pneumophila]|nr:hypothetical protein [Legionella pneumophila]